MDQEELKVLGGVDSPDKPEGEPLVGEDNSKSGSEKYTETKFISQAPKPPENSIQIEGQDGGEQLSKDITIGG